MKKTILSIGLWGCLLSVQANARQAHAYRAQANPASHKIWKTYTDAAKFIEGVLNTLQQNALAGANTGLPPDFHYSTKAWTKDDIANFAKCSETFDFFETILGLANASVKADKVGNYTADAVEAQEALTYLKPDCCKSWKGFYNMIADASDATETLRAQYHRNMEAKKKG